jgi:hypothetical protein
MNLSYRAAPTEAAYQTAATIPPITTVKKEDIRMVNRH